MFPARSLTSSSVMSLPSPAKSLSSVRKSMQWHSLRSRIGTQGQFQNPAFTFTNTLQSTTDSFFKASSNSSGVGGSYTAEIVESSCPAALGKGLLTLNATQVDDWADTILKQADYTATWADLGSTGTYSQMWRDPTHEIDSKLAFSAFPGRRLHSNDPHTGLGNYGGPDDAHSHSPSTGAHSTNGNAEVSFPKFSTKAGASWMLLKQNNMPTSTTPAPLAAPLAAAAF